MRRTEVKARPPGAAPWAEGDRFAAGGRGMTKAGGVRTPAPPNAEAWSLCFAPCSRPLACLSNVTTGVGGTQTSMEERRARKRRVAPSPPRRGRSTARPLDGRGGMGGGWPPKGPPGAGSPPPPRAGARHGSGLWAAGGTRWGVAAGGGAGLRPCARGARGLWRNAWAEPGFLQSRCVERAWLTGQGMHGNRARTPRAGPKGEGQVQGGGRGPGERGRAARTRAPRAPLTGRPPCRPPRAARRPATRGRRAARARRGTRASRTWRRAGARRGKPCRCTRPA
jgi:hypothetical protein